MKQGTKKALAMLLTLVLALGLACGALAEKTVSSPAFMLPVVRHRPTPEPVATPEPTAEPTVEPTAEPTAEPAAEPTAEPAPEQELPADRSVTFTFTWEGEELAYGDTVTLVPELSGYEGFAVELLWQYSLDNADWVDYAAGETAQYVLSEENIDWYWHVVVNVLGADAPEAEPAA